MSPVAVEPSVGGARAPGRGRALRRRRSRPADAGDGRRRPRGRDPASPQRASALLVTSLGRLPAARSAPEFAAQLSKPLKESQLYDVLARVLAEQGGRAAGTSPSRGEAAGVEAPDPARGGQRREPEGRARLLERLGYRADVAWNGREALEALERSAVRRRPHGRADARGRRARGLAPDPRAVAERRTPHRRDDGERPWPRIARRASPRAWTTTSRSRFVPTCCRRRCDGSSRARATRRRGPGRRRLRLDPAALANIRQIGGEDFLAELSDTFLVDAPGQLRRSGGRSSRRMRTRFGGSRTRSSRTARRSAPRGSPSSTSRNGQKRPARRRGACGQVEVELGRLRTALEALPRSPTRATRPYRYARPTAAALRLASQRHLVDVDQPAVCP